MPDQDVTRLLADLDDSPQGSPGAAERLLELVYAELRQLAAARLAKEKPGQTLQATALVHEAWLRLTGDERSDWKDRRYFFAAAAEAMRRILIERARRRGRLKHGGDRERVQLDDAELVALPPSIDLLALDVALGKLEADDAPKAELVKLRFFTGLTIEEAAATLGISKATADRHWSYARAYLFAEMGGAG